jgi:glycine oxidase
LCIVDNAGIAYKDIHAKHLIFCNGLEVNKNRFFPELVFYPTKGEIITVSMQAQPDAIICGNVFVLPIGNNLFHVGATFARTYDNVLPTQQGKEWLCTELEKIIDVPYTVVDHRVGIRPTTPGHRPMYYWHKEYPNIAVFSGFGAKGISYIPYCAQELLKNSHH